MRHRDWVGFVLTMLAVLGIVFGSVPARAADHKPPPKVERPKPGEPIWLQPGEEIIKDPHRLRDGHPYSTLPPMPKRMKDPQAWA